MSSMAHGDEAERQLLSAVQPHAQEPMVPSRGSFGMGAAIPTPQLLEEMTRDPGAPPLPQSFRKWLLAPFVPPEDEEWHVLNGFYVRMSRAELDQLLANADDSEYEDDTGSELATSVGDSDNGEGEDREFASVDDESTDELNA
eukprot:TRINITY_DN12045_c0_g1_i1.p1 TRINITY_DN12045_c0_g1~~TRINITY_DN12045_c0_g1_i1.p1  ORF type:complete len:161 (-),score=30.88 TRINITY_DN12045_c0_g1_i1:371-799(-)